MRVANTPVGRLQAVTNASIGVPLAAALLGAFTPGVATGQAVRDRDPSIAAFRDSLARGDTEQLRGVERSLMARVRRERTNPAIHVRLGMLAFRLGEYSDAASEFKWTTQLAPLSAPAWFGLGQAELALGETVDTTKAGRQALLAKDAWARSSQAFTRALAVDPTQIAALESLIQERLSADRRASADVVRDAVRRAASARTRTASLVLGLGRIERTLGDSGAAVLAFEAAAGLPGGRAIGLFESARIRLARQDERGLELYLEAAGLDDSASVASLRGDLAWIATGAELEQFDRLTGPARGRFVAEFWARRDRNDLRQTGERIREHYRRLAVAGRIYSNPDDQRVAVLVRHGEPGNRATARMPGVPANESWWYGRTDGDLVVHFVSGADPTHYRVTESLFDLADPGAPAGDDRAEGDLSDQLLRSRAQLSPFYQAAAAGRRDQLGPFRLREREIGLAGRNLALTTDRFPLRFSRDLPVRAQWLSLGADASRSRTDFVFAVPMFADLDSARSVRLRIVVWDSAAVPAVALDTIVAGQSSDDRPGPRFLRGHLAVALPPGRYSARAAVEVGTRGAVVTRDDLVVAADGGGRISELALGSPRNGSSVPISGLGAPVEVDPWGVYRRTDSLAVVAVAVGRPGAGAVEPMIAIRAARTDGKVERWRGWPELGRLSPVVVGSDGVARITLLLPLRKLKAGVYEVEVGIVGGSGASARRQGGFVVTDGEK